MNSETDKDRFARAYSYYIYEDRQIEALQICEELLLSNPKNHYARMLIACAQADSDDQQERLKGKENFFLSLKYCDDPSIIANGWLEENPLYHIALWERRNGSQTFSIIMFLIDYLLFKTKSSMKQILELLPALEDDQKSYFELVLTKISEWDRGGQLGK